MKTLYLMRHGIAVPPGTPEIADDDRPLTEKGEHRVREVAYGFKRLKPRLDRVISSPLPRALRTAEILVRVLGDPDLLTTDDALRAGRSAEEIQAWLSDRTEEDLLIVGHNPAFSDLVSYLVTGRLDVKMCELRRAGIAALTSGNDQRMSIDWIARPQILRRLSDL